jgi:hypothetical protein
MRYLPAHKVQTAVNAYQGTGSHIPNEAIVFNGYVPYGDTFSALTEAVSRVNEPVARRRSDSIFPETEA